MSIKLKTDNKAPSLNILRDDIKTLRKHLIGIINVQLDMVDQKKLDAVRASLEGKFVGVNKRAIETKKSVEKDIEAIKAYDKEMKGAMDEIDTILSELIKKYNREEELELKTLQDIKVAIVGLDERILAIETKPGFWKKVGRFFKRLVIFWR